MKLTLIISALLACTYGGYIHGTYVGSLGGKYDTAGFEQAVDKIAIPQFVDGERYAGRN